MPYADLVLTTLFDIALPDYLFFNRGCRRRAAGGLHNIECA